MSFNFNSRDIRENSGEKAKKLVGELQNQGVSFEDEADLDVGIFGVGKPVNKHRTLLCLAKDRIDENPREAVRYGLHFIEIPTDGGKVMRNEMVISAANLPF